MSYNDIRPIFEKIWDFNQNFVPMDAEKGSKKQKSPEKERSPEKIVEEKVDTQEEKEEVVKEPGTKRKKSIPRKSTRKRQKMEEDSEKEELKEFLDIVSREEVPIEVESISTKFPIVDWKSYVLTETFMYYQIFRGDGSSKNYKIFTEMLRDFDRHYWKELIQTCLRKRHRASRPGSTVWITLSVSTKTQIININTSSTLIHQGFQLIIYHNVYSPPSSIPQIEYAPTVNQQQQQPEFPPLDLGLTVLVFKQGDDLIDAINHMISFLSAVVTSRYLTTNNQLRNLSNPRQQATINDGRITLQPDQGR
ncbi:hypothetical protein Tco_0747711 [Tanacetum coccineum]|uniref:Yeast cadmium factor 1 n=1 Tax=Tanacetum coccineum TaxID=301880 RepID=A0ABQ4YUG4_9ASTR